MSPFLRVISALNRAGVGYVVVGGWAVVLHGRPRLTVDVDLVVALDTQNATKAVQCLLALGLRARAPVDPLGFCDQATRDEWIAQRNMVVFSMVDPDNPFFSADLFVAPPIPFEVLACSAIVLDVEDVPIRVCSVVDLIAMKRVSGRAEDLADIAFLEGLSHD